MVNTKTANGKHKKQHIFKSEQEDGVIVGDAELKAYITKYYKGLFRPPEENNFILVEHHNQDIPRVSEEENNLLTTPFTRKEVKR